MDKKENITAPYSLRDLVLYFLKLGSLGFGGPVALTGYMHRDLVETRKWISEEDYREGLALAQLAPGPLAAQLGIYMGYVHYRVLGATLAGLAFVLPSFLLVVLLGFVYTVWEGIPLMQSVFYGVAAAVIGIIAMSAWKRLCNLFSQLPVYGTAGALFPEVWKASWYKGICGWSNSSGYRGYFRRCDRTGEKIADGCLYRWYCPAHRIHVVAV